MDRISIFSLIKTENPNNLIHHEKWNEICNDPYFVYELIKNGKFSYFNLIPKKIFNSYSLCLLVFKYIEPDISLIPIKYLKRPEFLISVLDENYYNIKYIPKQYLNNIKIIEWLCFKYGHLEILQYFPLKYTNNYNICKNLIIKNSENYNHISPLLKKDKNLFNFCYDLHLSPDIFCNSSINIKNDPIIVSKVIKNFNHLYKEIGSKLSNSIPFFLNSLKNCPDILEYSNRIIKDNEQCVWASININPLSTQFASERLMETSSFCLQICKDMNNTNFEISFPLWSQAIKNDKALVEELLPKICLTKNLSYLSDELINDYELMQKAILLDFNNLNYIGKNLKNNAQFYIDLYNLMNKTDHLKDNSHIFSFLLETSINNPLFLLKLYHEYDNDFFSIIFPHIKNKTGNLIDKMNEVNQVEGGLLHFMQKLKLKYKLEEQFLTPNPVKNIIHKI